MKAKDLITLLHEVPPDAEIFVNDHEGDEGAATNLVILSANPEEGNIYLLCNKYEYERRFQPDD